MEKSPPKSYRLSAETLKLIEALREKLGLRASGAAIIDEAIRRMAEQEGIKSK